MADVKRLLIGRRFGYAFTSTNMAEKGWPQSVQNNFPKLSLRHVLLLQAHIRGLIVRSQMKRVREEFVMVFNEIQQEDDLFVSWKNQFLCLPTFATVKEEKSKCFGLKSIKKPHGPRETTPMESNTATTKGDQKDLCSPCDEDRLSTTSPQHSVKTPDREDDELESRFVGREKDSKKLLSSYENQPLPLLSNASFEKPNIVEHDSESVKTVISSDESQQKNPQTTLNKPEHFQTPPENRVCIPKDKDASYSQDPSNESKNIHNTSMCLKPIEMEDRSESQILDSTFTDVTSVWGDSILSLSQSVDSLCETLNPETVASLQLQRQNIALELVWLQQAIASRKNYLRLKHQMDFS